MADDADLNLLFVAEILVIAHLARDEGIGTCLDGCVEQESTCSTAECHLPDRTSKQLVALHALHAKPLLEHQHQVVGCQVLSHLSDDALAAFHAVHFLLASKELHVSQSQFLGNLEVHAARSRIHVGMHRHDGNIILNRLAHGTLHVVLVRDSRQFAEYQRMMAHDEVTALPDGLVYHGFSNVKTQQCP